MTFPKNQSVSKRFLVTTTALALMAVLAGCSDGNAEELDNAAKTSDAETEYIPASADGPAQNVPEPNLPAVATENTEEGAEATLNYFWEAVDYARLTGETDPLKLVSHESCEFCTEFIVDWEEAYEESQWAVVDGEARIDVDDTWVGVEEGRNAPSADILFSVSDAAVDLYGADGNLDKSSEENASAEEWFAILLYDATAQRWEIEWTGLEELVDWEGE